MDSLPTHTENGIKPNITEDQMIDLCLDEIHKILKIEKDKRFSIYMMQICSLSGTDPLELMTDNIS